MTALPDDFGPEEEWDDEWNADDWYDLGVADRNYRNEDTWGNWLIKLAVVTVVLPLVLGLLAWVLILIF
jgi:hypothetical protein